jgi:integrase/recombinase XerD
MKKSITLSQACDGLVRYKSATGMSPNTIRNYRTTFAKLQAYFASHPEPGKTESQDPAFDAITRDQLIDFFAWLRDEYLSEPDGAAPRGQIKLAPKTILNVHTDLSGLWTWGVEEGFVPTNIVRTIDPPDPKAPVVETLTKEEIDALLGACDRSKTWKSRQVVANERPTADRDRAIILLLLDTGLRASELCGIKFGDINLTTNSIKVLGKGQKERLVYFGKRTSKALWKLLTPRLKDAKSEALVFTVGPEDDLRPMTRDVLRRLLVRIGERAGVANVYPHRFRHTFAITYLRNQGDLFTLQDLLGHSDMAMVKRYARIAQTDCAKAHQKASPVDNWRL